MAIRDTARRKLTYEDYLLFPEDGLAPPDPRRGTPFRLRRHSLHRFAVP